MKYVGVDGCKGGWLSVALTESGTDFEVFPDFASLWGVHQDAEIILVDMPIGLPDKATPVRQADVLARKILGKRHSCVFSPGVRGLWKCADYGEACQENRRVIGKKISQQYWNIVPKITDVDSTLQRVPSAVKLVRESHPEIAFLSASGEKILDSKKTEAGKSQRLEILDKFINDFRAMHDTFLMKHPRKTVAGDDLLDAAILAVSARESRGCMRPLPDPPEHDETGLPMAIWWHDFTKTKEEL